MNRSTPGADKSGRGPWGIQDSPPTTNGIRRHWNCALDKFHSTRRAPRGDSLRQITNYPDLAELHRSSKTKEQGATKSVAMRTKRNTPLYARHAPGNQKHRTTPRIARNPAGNPHDGNTILTDASSVVAALLRLAPAGTALRPAPLRAALGRTLGLPLAALLRGRLPARGTSLRRHGSNDSELRVQHNCFELGNGEVRLQSNDLFT